MYIDIMDKFYQFLTKVEELNLNVNSPRNLPLDLFPSPEVIYTRALLQSHFHPRKFTEKEVKDLLDEVFDPIPQWYKDKWL